MRRHAARSPDMYTAWPAHMSAMSQVRALPAEYIGAFVGTVRDDRPFTFHALNSGLSAEKVWES